MKLCPCYCAGRWLQSREFRWVIVKYACSGWELTMSPPSLWFVPQISTIQVVGWIRLKADKSQTKCACTNSYEWPSPNLGTEWKSCFPLSNALEVCSSPTTKPGSFFQTTCKFERVPRPNSDIFVPASQWGIHQNVHTGLVHLTVHPFQPGKKNTWKSKWIQKHGSAWK